MEPLDSSGVEGEGMFSVAEAKGLKWDFYLYPLFADFCDVLKMAGAVFQAQTAFVNRGGFGGADAYHNFFKADRFNPELDASVNRGVIDSVGSWRNPIHEEGAQARPVFLPIASFYIEYAFTEARCILNLFDGQVLDTSCLVVKL